MKSVQILPLGSLALTVNAFSKNPQAIVITPLLVEADVRERRGATQRNFLEVLESQGYREIARGATDSPDLCRAAFAHPDRIDLGAVQGSLAEYGLSPIN